MKLKFLLPVLALTLVINACHESGIDAYGPIVTESRNVNEFTAIRVGLPANVYVSQDPQQSLQIETHEDLLPNIDSYVSNGELILDLNRNIRNIERLNIYVSAADFEKIRLSGAANVRSEGCLSLNSLDLRVSGAGNITLCGTVDNLDVRISGAGNFRGYEMVSQSVDAKVSGAGNLRVTAEQMLDATISGAGNIYYRGNPEIFSDVSGAGSLINAN